MSFTDLRKTLTDAGAEPATATPVTYEAQVTGQQLTWRAADGTAFTATGATLDEAAAVLAQQLEQAGEPQTATEVEPAEEPAPDEE
jgi:hypothetical protein